MFSSPSSPTSIFWNICLAIVSTSSWHDIQYYMEDLVQLSPLELLPCHEVCPRSQASHQVQQCLCWNSSTTCESLEVTFSLPELSVSYISNIHFSFSFGEPEVGMSVAIKNSLLIGKSQMDMSLACSPESRWFLLYRCQINWKGAQRKFSHFLAAITTLVKQTQPRIS